MSHQETHPNIYFSAIFVPDGNISPKWDMMLPLLSCCAYVLVCSVYVTSFFQQSYPKKLRLQYRVPFLTSLASSFISNRSTSSVDTLKCSFSCSSSPSRDTLDIRFFAGFYDDTSIRPKEQIILSTPGFLLNSPMQDSSKLEARVSLFYVVSFIDIIIAVCVCKLFRSVRKPNYFMIDGTLLSL